MAEVTQDTTQQTTSYSDAVSQEMIEAGLFYGRKKSHTNPRMKQYVSTNRNGIEIIDLEKTAHFLEKAVAFVKEKFKEGAQALLVGTEPEARAAILSLVDRFKLLYVTNRWAGGTLTNFKVISKRVEYFRKLASDLEKGALDKYTKKERLGIEREINRLRFLFGGLESFEKLPDVLIVINPAVHDAAVREARKSKIPVIALSNVDTDPRFIDYLVPGNDKSRKSIQFFLDKIGGGIAEGISARQVAVAAAAEKKEEKGDEVTAKKDGA